MSSPRNTIPSRGDGLVRGAEKSLSESAPEVEALDFRGLETQTELPPERTELRRTSPDRTRRADLDQLHRSFDLERLSTSSHRRWLGPWISFVKTLVFRILTPLCERQTRFNEATLRLVVHQQRRIDALEAGVERLTTEADAMGRDRHGNENPPPDPPLSTVDRRR